MSRQFIPRYAVPWSLFADTPEAALPRLLDAAAVNLGPTQRFHGEITEAGEAVYLFTANRAKARRLAARMDATLEANGHLSYLSANPDADGLCAFVQSKG